MICIGRSFSLVYVYLRMYTCMYACVRASTHVYMPIQNVYMYLRVCMCVHAYLGQYAQCVRAGTHVYMCVSMRTS